LGVRLRTELCGLAWTRLLDAIPHPKMFAAYGASDVVMNMSELEGGMSNVLVEALSPGKVVLASNVEGNHTAIQDGLNGLLYESEGNSTRRLGS